MAEKLQPKAPVVYDQTEMPLPPAAAGGTNVIEMGARLQRTPTCEEAERKGEREAHAQEILEFDQRQSEGIFSHTR